LFFKVLVFSQSLLSLDLIEAFLKLENDTRKSGKPEFFGTWVNGQDYFRMDGSTPPDVRKKWCSFFNKVICL
jgi:transcriptional regulator ATRX